MSVGDAGDEAGQDARQILSQFERDGFLAVENVRRAEFGVWDRVTPGWILLAVLSIALRLRRENSDHSAELIPADVAPDISPEDVHRIADALRGDVTEVKEIVRRNLLSLDSVIRIIMFVTRSEMMSDKEIDQIFRHAKQFCQEALEILERGSLSGAFAGPVDISDMDPSTVCLTDLGGLHLRVLPEAELQPMRADGEIVAVTVVQAGTAVQLQAFRASCESSWASIREQMVSRLRTQGATVREWVGLAGIEIRAVISADVDGRPTTQNIRVLGCDGPGWMLRGIVSGAGAAEESDEAWAYEVFAGTVVDPSFHASEGGDSLVLKWPPSAP
ncbi:DUF3710 domain-containing protein [Streptomyces zhihengii]|uniref:DUF3710 domain-containing protein n=1 Tax=Streptomyces zhihengii TaxID=1818004 RepID=UPI0036A45BF9